MIVVLVAGGVATVGACAREDDGDAAASCDGAQGKSTSACSTGPQYPEELAYAMGLNSRGHIFHCSCTSGSWRCVKMRNSWIVGTGCPHGPTDASTVAIDAAD